MGDVPTVHVLGSGGGVVEMSLPLHDDVANQILKGQARIVNADGSPINEAERPTEAPSLPTERPPLNASKATWVGWAVVNGAAPDEAEGLTKQDLIEKYGSIEPGTGAHASTEPVDPPTDSITTGDHVASEPAA